MGMGMGTRMIALRAIAVMGEGVDILLVEQAAGFEIMVVKMLAA